MNRIQQNALVYGALPENFFAVAPSILPTVAESLT